MKTLLRQYLNDFTHLFFPHYCLGCETDELERDQLICSECHKSLPETGYLSQSGNAIEKKFYGRLNIQEAGSALYFTKHSIIQQIMFALKYKGNKEAGIFLGKLLGKAILQSNRFKTIDCIVPLPLNPKREKERGYNQAELIAEGLSQVCKWPINNHVMMRNVYTETQTHKNRISRWQNMQGVFDISNENELRGKHVLLVDDVITTGATLETCGALILQVPETKLSIATAATAIL